MAWITKNSATMQVPRREQPYLTDEMKAQLERDTVPRYPTRQASTMPVLHLIQDTYGWIPPQAIEEAADFLGLEPSVVMDTASFYEDFFLQPRGKYTIWVCESISCELMGAKKLLAKAKAKLGIEPFQTTPDEKFTLMIVECLGSCGTAPVVLINHDLHEGLTADNFDRIIDSLP